MSQQIAGIEGEPAAEPRQYAVLLIGFNRPHLMRQVLDSIRPARPKTLMVCIDGARVDRPEDQAKIDATAKLFDDLDWPCDVEIHRQPRNLGCRYNPAYAISWMLEKHGAGVILEDDCVASPSFLPFCWELLERYEHDTRISMISGVCHDVMLNQGVSYGFSKYCYIHGWATWKDRWEGMDLEMRDSPEITRLGLLDNVFGPGQVSRFWTLSMQRVHSGHVRAITSWDIQWNLHNFLNHRLGIVPTVNLIDNIGTGPDATNSLPTDYFLHMEAKTLEFPLRHPKYMVVDAKADAINEHRRFSRKPAPVRAVRRIWRELKTIWIRKKDRPALEEGRLTP